LSTRHSFVFIMATITDDFLSVQLAVMEVTDKESNWFRILFKYSVFKNGLSNTRECYRNIIFWIVLARKIIQREHESKMWT